MKTSPIEPTPTRRPIRDTGATLPTLSGLAAAFAVASCCGLPFLLATAGVGSAWLAGIAMLAAPHRPLLLTIAAICLMAGAVLLLRRRPAVTCATGAVCSRPAIRSMTIIGLVAGLILLTIGYLYA
ncbi:MAG: mercuric transporter MerT family protein [Acidiphilium sp.]